MSNHRKFLRRTSAAAAIMALFSSPALAQDDAAEDEEIIVTGTQIRGVEATGSAPLRLDREEIQQSGAFNVRELMANIPLLSTNSAAYTPEVGNGERPDPPTIRNLDAFAGATSTLILIDGGRMAGTGTRESFADPSIIPPSALQSVDIVTGGGSAIYGADAVGGVINFVTRTDFDGTEIGARYGFTEDGYSAYSADAAHGWDWDGGSFALFYSLNGNDTVERRDQSNLIFNFVPSGGTDLRGQACDPVTVLSGGIPYNSATGTAYATAPRCNSDSGTFVPEALGHSLFAGLRQDLASGVELQVRAYYHTRETESAVTPTVYATFPVTNAAAPDPVFGGGVLATPYTPIFSFDGVRQERTTTEQVNYGFRPTLSIDLPGEWQLRTTINYSRSEYVWDDMQSPAGTDILLALNGGLPGLAGQFLNPFDLASTNPAVLAELWDTTERYDTEQELASINAVFDGPLFTMPSGDPARLAIGGELSSVGFDGHRVVVDAGSAPTINTSADAQRSIGSAFAELHLPLVGDQNNFPLVHSLDLSLAVRYDDYSDFGDTTNPLVGVVWRPVESLALRGKWATSFAAPSLTDTSGAVDTSVRLIFGGLSAVTNWAILGLFLPDDAQGDATVTAYQAGLFLPTPYVPPILQLEGGGQALRPEESESYELGFDWDVPFIDGLRVSATYWDVLFENRISALAGIQKFLRADEGRLFLANEVAAGPIPADNLTQADFEAFLVSIGVNPTTPHLLFPGVGTDLTALYAAFPGAGGLPAGPSMVADTRRTNQGRVHLWGIDASISYLHMFGWGALFADLNASQTLGDERSVPGGAWVDQTQLANTNYGDVRFTLSGGFTTGPWTARATLNYTPGYSLTDGTANPLGYYEVDSFTPVDVFASYRFEQPDGPLSGLELSVSVDNVLNEAPSFRLGSNGGGNGNTLGRLVSVGVRKRF